MTYQYMDGTIVSGSTPVEVLTNLAGGWLMSDDIVNHFSTTLYAMGMNVGDNPNATSLLTLMIDEGILTPTEK
jgi:hypothetical protein